MKGQVVDPSVSRAKFDREIARFRAIEDIQFRRGCWVAGAEFPEVFVIFGTPRLRPAAVMFGVLLDFTNYDLWPPSVRMVDPFTRRPYAAGELPSALLRQLPHESREATEALAALPAGGPPGIAVQPMMQAHRRDEVPFLCLPGVREYHDHPGHTGDSWLLRRTGGEGTLHFILEQLWRYGAEPITSWGIKLQPGSVPL